MKEGDIQQRIAEGEKARTALGAVADDFTEVQRDLINDVMQAVRTGVDPTLAAMRLTSLDDVVTLIIERIETGKRASRKLEDRLNG